jgi:Cu/Ag efflux protein CusF
MPKPGRSIGRRIARTEILASRAFVALLFVVLLAAFAVGIWGTVLRPAAYEVRGVLVARPAPDLIVVRHEPVAGLGMGAMELMAVSAEPALLDPLAPKPGDRVKLAVRQRDDRLVLLRIERLP